MKEGGENGVGRATGYMVVVAKGIGRRVVDVEAKKGSALEEEAL